MNAGLSVQGLTFSYAKGGPSAVEGFALNVSPGEIVAVVGPSGCGKTTLLRLIGGLLTPSSGSIAVGGKDLAGVPPERRPVAMVFQGFALFPHLDVASNLEFGLRVRKVGQQDRDARVREVAERLEITSILSRRPSEISGGERQRVALGRALLREPTAFLLDEPLSSLDPLLRTAARRTLDVVLRQESRCAVYVTHDQAEAMTLGDRLVVMRDGRCEQVGTAAELYEHPASIFVASFIGTPQMSLLPAGAAGINGPAGSVTIGVRAEHVRLVPGDEATVVRVDDLGHENIAELDLGAGILFARLPRDHSVQRGARTGFVVEQGFVHAFDSAGRAVR